MIKICEHCEDEGCYPEGSKTKIATAGKVPDKDGYALLGCPHCRGTGKPVDARQPA